MLAFSFSLMAGCDACHSPPPIPAQDAGDAGIFDIVPLPEKKELVEIWEEASAKLAVKKGEAFPVAYSIPSCALRYQMRSVVLGEVAEGRDPAGVEVIAELVANPDTDRLTWRVAELDAYLLHDGVRTLRPATPSDWAPARVHTDGESWDEDRGPTTLWASYTAVPPLTGQFPKVTRGVKVGTSYAWNMKTLDKRTTAKVEKRRAEDPDAAVPNFTADVAEVTMTLSSFVGIGSVKAAVFEGEWKTQKVLLDPIESHRAERWRGRWVVTDKGRLLHGMSMAGRYQWWAASPDERNSKLGSHEIELRLVEGCGGPTLPRFPKGDPP